jgi:hypothetical protein
MRKDRHCERKRLVHRSSTSEGESNPVPQAKNWIASSQGLLAMTNIEANRVKEAGLTRLAP